MPVTDLLVELLLTVLLHHVQCAAAVQWRRSGQMRRLVAAAAQFLVHKSEHQPFAYD